MQQLSRSKCHRSQSELDVNHNWSRGGSEAAQFELKQSSGSHLTIWDVICMSDECDCRHGLRNSWRPTNFDFNSFIVGYGGWTLQKTGFSKESTFGQSFGRFRSGEASKSASGWPSADRGPILKFSV